jgi:Protein of unknown function (DUF3102)
MSALSAANGPEPPTFNYASLDPDVAVDAREAAQRIQTRMRNNILETGRDLIAVKDRMEHGAFGAWVSAELNISMRTAERCMNGSRLLARKSDTVSHLPHSIIYALATPSAPVAVVDKIIDDVEAGVTITAAQIKTEVAAAIQAERNAKIEAAKSPDQIKKDQKARKLADKRAARREADATKTWKRAAQERADRLRPLAHRIIVGVGSDLAEMLRALNDYHDRSSLCELLTEGATENVAARADVLA